jgi:hypothetical protein
LLSPLTDKYTYYSRVKGVRGYDMAKIGVLIWDIRSDCIGSFDFYEFNFCPCSCYRGAHEFAQFGLWAEVGCSGWVDEAQVLYLNLLPSILLHVER